MKKQKCLVCNKEFRKSSLKNYCSKKCVGRLYSKRSCEKNNKFIINGLMTFLVIRGYETLIDTEDIEKIKDYCWGIDGKGYVYRHKNINNSRISLHRFLLNPPKDKVIDHINHNPKDNRKINLRICSQSDNLLNKSFFSRNTTGIIGVSKGYKGYRARIKIMNKKLEKNFINKEDAIIQRRQWEKELMIL